MHANEIRMDNTNPAIEHLDGTVHSCKTSSHCTKASISTILSRKIQQIV